MALFGLLKERCFYCRRPIERGKEFVTSVMVPGYVGTFQKSFCCEDHATSYVQDIEKKPKGSGGSCCH
ncbi:MAG: hypothetical protein GXP63_06820 [DPANN group archaeon]|nr:hypothetical protein [DPANN group archaeon]